MVPDPYFQSLIYKSITVLTHNSDFFVRPKRCDFFGKCDYLGDVRLFWKTEDSASKLFMKSENKSLVIRKNKIALEFSAKFKI